MTRPAALELICAGIGCTTVQPIPIGRDDSFEVEGIERTGADGQGETQFAYGYRLQGSAAFAGIHRPAYPMAEF